MQRALEAALTIQNEKHKATALTGLAPYLSSEAMPRVLEAALAIQDGEDKVIVLAKLLPCISKQSDLLYTIHKTIADHLWKNLPTQQRQDVLHFLASESLFEPPIIDQNILAAIARSISEICFGWRWL